MRIHLVLVLVVGRRLLWWLRLLRRLRLVSPQNRVATAIRLELLHLLLELQVGCERHLRHGQRVLRLRLRLGRLLLCVATFQDGPSLGFGHLLTRVGLLQIPVDVTSGHTRRLMISATHLLGIWLLLWRRRRLLLGLWLMGHLGRNRIGVMSSAQMVVRNLRRRTLLLVLLRRRRLMGRMLTDKSTQVSLLLLLLLGQRVVQAEQNVLVERAVILLGLSVDDVGTRVDSGRIVG